MYREQMSKAGMVAVQTSRSSLVLAGRPVVQTACCRLAGNSGVVGGLVVDRVQVPGRPLGDSGWQSGGRWRSKASSCAG